jgi:hypothetical protein
MQRAFASGIALVAMLVACSQGSEPAGSAEETSATPEQALDLGPRLYAGAGLSGLPLLPRSAFLDRAATIRLLDAVYAGTDAATGFVRHQGQTYSAKPLTAFRAGGRIYLLVHHAQDEESHAAQAYTSAYVIRETDQMVQHSFPFLASGGDWGGQESWGAEPGISVVPLSGGAVLILLGQNYQQQGYEFEWEEVIIIESGAARSLERIEIFSSSEGAAIDDMPYKTERLIGAELGADGRSIQLQYDVQEFTGSELVPRGSTRVYRIPSGGSG